MDFVLTAEINEASTDVIICSKDHQYMRNNKLNYWKILASILKKPTKKENDYKVFEQNTLSTKFWALFNFQMQIILNLCDGKQPVTYKATGWHACTCTDVIERSQHCIFCTALSMTLAPWDWAQSHFAAFFFHN